MGTVTALESLPGIDPKLATDLRATGAEEAADRLEDAGLRDCVNAIPYQSRTGCQ